MKDLPKPHINDSWPPDIAQDYARASGDDERCRIMLAAGYDKAHRADAARLFPKLIHKQKDEFKDIVEKIDPEEKENAPGILSYLKKIPPVVYFLAAIGTIICTVLAVLTFNN